MTPKRRLYTHSEIGDESDRTRASCPHPPPTCPTGRLGTRVVVVGGGGDDDTGKIALSCQIAIEGRKEGCPPSTSTPLSSSPSLLRCRLCEIEARSRRNGSGRLARAARVDRRPRDFGLASSLDRTTPHLYGGEGFVSRVEWLCNFTTLKMRLSI